MARKKNPLGKATPSSLIAEEPVKVKIEVESEHDEPEEEESEDVAEEKGEEEEEEEDEDEEEEDEDGDEDEDDDDDDDGDEDEDEDEEDEEDEDEDEEDEEDEDEEDTEAMDEEKNENSKRETLRKLLEPFGKDQLIEILKEAARKNSSLTDRLSKAADSDRVHRDLFVFGLGWDCTTEALLSVFKQYGEIEDGKVVMDNLSGKCKGYGFVLFKTRDGARKALKEPQKKIGNRMTSCNLASNRSVPNQPGSDVTNRRIFVSNVGPQVLPEKLKAFFAQFGEIEEGPIGCDRVTGKFRGYAMFIYKTIEGCKKALEEPSKQFDGCALQCSIAVDGSRAKNKQTSFVPPGSAPVVPQSNLPLNYTVGVNPGMVGQNYNPAGVHVGQSGGFGVMNPGTGTGTFPTQTGLPPIGSGLSSSVNRSGVTPHLGLGASYGGPPGINSISPSAIGSYGSQAALHGLGAYQAAQLGQPSAAAATRPQSAFGSFGAFPSYYGR